MSNPSFPQPASRRSARAEGGDTSSSSPRRGASQPGGQRPRAGSGQGGGSAREDGRPRSGRAGYGGEREDSRRDQGRPGARPPRARTTEEQGRSRPDTPPDTHSGSRSGGRQDKRSGAYGGQGRGYTPAGGRPRRTDSDTPARQQPSPVPGAGGSEEHTRIAGQELAPMLPGVKPVLELLEQNPERVDAVFLRKGRHGKEMDTIIDLCRAAGVRFSLLDAPSFARVYTGSSQGVVARLFEAGYVPLEELLDKVMDAPMPLVLVLDQVQDPGNAGTLARTLYALGGAGLIAPRHNGVYLGAAAAKAAAGALERLPVVKAGNLGQAVDAAKKLGFTVYGATATVKNAGPDDGEIPNFDPLAVAHDIFSLTPRFPALLLLGGEEGGLRPNMLKRCDVLVKIPMLRDFDSINVAQAGAIILSWFTSHMVKKS